MSEFSRLSFLTFGEGAPEPETFLAEVLDGWDRAQRAADLDRGTIRSRRARVLDLVEFSGHYPWEWSVSDADEYFAHARGVRNLAHSTVRSY